MLNRLRVFDETEYDEFELTTSLDFSAVKEKLYRARDEGLLKFSDTGYSLTEKGRWMLNDILELFLQITVYWQKQKFKLPENSNVIFFNLFINKT